MDKQDDILDLVSLEDAVYSYMEETRETGEMHREFGIGKVIESFVVTPEKMAALGMTCDKTGWVVGVKIKSADIWAKVASGEYGAFSIGGVGEYEDAA